VGSSVSLLWWTMGGDVGVWGTKDGLVCRFHVMPWLSRPRYVDWAEMVIGCFLCVELVTGIGFHIGCSISLYAMAACSPRHEEPGH
jgi:hypothetical protein